jgi:hypothetical protein
MNRTPIEEVGVDEQYPVEGPCGGLVEQDPVEGWLNSSRWRLDEQDPVDEQYLVEAGGSQRWMNSSRWRLEEVDGG